MIKVGWHRIVSFFAWHAQAKSWRNVHSPWLFNLLLAMRNRKHSQADIENERKQLLNDHRTMPVVDFGAGSTGDIRTVAGIAHRALKRPKHAQALAALAQYIRAEHVLELGTSLGVTTAYLSRSSVRVWTLEGNPHIASEAHELWERLELENITCIQGPFETTYPIALQEGKLFDLIFIDGNHRGDALAQYVKEAMPFLSEKGIIVCDDIHWSADMEAAWHVLCDEPHWTLRADFQEWGLLTQNPDLKREFQALRF